MRVPRTGFFDWLAIIVAIGITGCEQTLTPVSLDGTIKVFSADPHNPIFGKNSDWVRLGDYDGVSIKSVYEGSVLVLQIKTTEANAAFLRRVNAQLLATPFLFWSWSVINGPPVHPVRLVIGFADEDVEVSETVNGEIIFGRPKLPPFSRTLTLVWEGSALQRGTLSAEPARRNGKPRARYVVRGGRESRNQWWTENLNLSRLHSIAWPDVDTTRSRIVFMGISTTGGSLSGTMRIAQFKLSR